jgi:hypothetical protein
VLIVSKGDQCLGKFSISLVGHEASFFNNALKNLKIANCDHNNGQHCFNLIPLAKAANTHSLLSEKCSEKLLRTVLRKK